MMQHAKRMVLVDEKFLDNFWMKEQSTWKRSSDHKAKSRLNHELQSDLDDPSIPNDIKAKQYQQHLNRFLYTARQLPAAAESEAIIEAPTKTVDELLDLVPIKKIKKAKKIVLATRRSKRKAKKVKWEAWE
jgi:hypothetical protein